MYSLPTFSCKCLQNTLSCKVLLWCINSTFAYSIIYLVKMNLRSPIHIHVTTSDPYATTEVTQNSLLSSNGIIMGMIMLLLIHRIYFCFIADAVWIINSIFFHLFSISTCSIENHWVISVKSSSNLFFPPPEFGYSQVIFLFAAFHSVCREEEGGGG